MLLVANVRENLRTAPQPGDEQAFGIERLNALSFDRFPR